MILVSSMESCRSERVEGNILNQGSWKIPEESAVRTLLRLILRDSNTISSRAQSARSR